MRLGVLRPRSSPPPAESAPAPRGPGARRPWSGLPDRFRLPSNREVRDTLRHNLSLKLLSLLLAIFLWFSFNVSEPDAETTFETPLRVDYLAPELIVTNLPSRPVSVTVRGPRTILDGVNERRMRFSLDLSGASPGETRLDLSGEMVRPELPERLKVQRIDPARVRVRIERLTRKRVPVRAELAGQPALGYTVAQAMVLPNEVEVSGPASKLRELTDIRTEPVYLRRAAERLERTVLLSWVADYVTFTPDHVKVTVTFQEAMMSRVFENVEVTVRNAPSGLAAQVVPRGVELTIAGPQRVLASLVLADGSVWVDAAGLDAGPHRVAPRVDLPQGLEVTRREPEALTLQLGAKGRTR